MENTHSISCFSKKLLEREKNISYQVNMNHYLYQKGYDPSKGINGELQHFKKSLLGTKPFQKFRMVTKKFIKKTIITI